MKAEKLPSGRWRARAYNRYTGERPSFTAESKKEAERMARQYEFNSKPKEGSDMLFRDALSLYIESREALNRSVRTIADYRKNAEKHYGPIKDIPLSRLTDEDIQRYIDDLSKEYAPKTVKNLSSLITATMDKYAHRKPQVELPKINKPSLYLPSENDIQKLLDACEGNQICSAVYLSVFGALRRGEVCALDMDHISGNEVYIEYDIVQNSENEWIKKHPKTDQSMRRITVPDIVIDKIKKYGLPKMTPNQLSKRFSVLLKENDLPHFRFHDLRHFCAAKLLSIPLPLVFVKQYGGWESDEVLLQIYNYEIEEIKKKATEKWNSVANDFLLTSHEMPTDF